MVLPEVSAVVRVVVWSLDLHLMNGWASVTNARV